MVRISADPSGCVGAAQCVLTAPDVFDQDDDGFVQVLDEQPTGAAAEAARLAASLCPSQSITLRES